MKKNLVEVDCLSCMSSFPDCFGISPGSSLSNVTFADWQKLPARKPAASSPSSDEIWIFEELLIRCLFKNALLMKAEL